MSASQNNSSISGISIIGAGEPAEAPVAKITASTLQGPAPLTVNFTGSGSTGGVSYLWNFGDGSTASSANANHTFAQPGVYQVTLRVQGASGAFNSASTTVTVREPEITEGVSLYLNAGSSSDVSVDGQTYVGDAKFPSYYGTSGTHSLPNANGGPLYSTERNGKNLNYAIPLANGTYTVQTHHTELWFGLNGPSAMSGRRVFDISIEGALVKDNFDIFDENSNQPTVLTFENIVVTDGVLNISMSASQNNSSISGISIFVTSSKTTNPANFRKNTLNNDLYEEKIRELTNEEWEITLYPNPAQSQTMLYINPEVQLNTILIHDMGGRLVRQLDPEVVRTSDGSYYIQLKNVPQGVYLISLLSTNNLITQLRLIVKP